MRAVRREPVRAAARLIGVVALAVLTLAPGRATASSDQQAPDAAYEAAFIRGNELFDAEDWAGARAHYKKAYAERKNPLLLFNIGSTYRREGKLAEARLYYQRCLAEAPGDAGYRVQVREAITKLDQEIAAARKKPAPDAGAKEEGRSRDEREPDAKGDGGAVRLDLSGRSVDSDGGTSRPMMRGAGLALMVVGAVGLGWGGYEGWLAASKSDDLSNLNDGSDWTPELQAEFDRGETAEARAPVLLGVGAVGVASGVALYLLGRGAKAEGDPRAVTLAPQMSGDQVGVTVRFGF